MDKLNHYRVLCWMCIVALGLLFSSPALAQGSKQVRNRKIRTVHTQIHEVKKGVVQLQYLMSVYDRKGNLTLSMEWDQDSTLVRKEENLYSKKGLIVEKKVFAKDNALTSWVKWEYDAWGHVIREIEMRADGKVKASTQTFYDKHGEKTKEEERDEQGLLLRTIAYEYDARGMIARKVITNKEGEVVFDKTIQYVY